MKYIGSENFDHDQPARVGVLVTNLGTPQAPTRAALRTYLKQFLADPRVVEVPRLIWWFILNGIILNLRPARSAKAYASVWTEQGSPLMVHTQAQATKLKHSLEGLYGEDIVVDFAMRYGSPSIDSVLQSMLERGVRKLLVMPLYPQYSGPTTGSTFDAIAADFKHRRWLPQLRFISQYCDHPGYIAALAASIQTYRAEHGEAEKLVFSYHGEPMRYLEQGDPYHCQCLKTTRLVAEILGLADDEYLSCFQSRFGREEWLKPYTDATLKELAGNGTKSVQVICPGFSADCLETIEEIGIENRDYFIEAGGESFHYIPCLNDEQGHIEALTQLAVENLRGWLESAS
ncbi:MAG: ferrochelatase [Halieaceae bacterium]|jgi:ferrochelatase|nr:ferrochelatase [Halieaceae bacterium]MBT6124667.1 ferrochelatase [Halieaceae bacterium]